jgi:hypothetical protein
MRSPIASGSACALTCHGPGRPPWVAAGLNERFRVYRYVPGQYFRWHLDGAFQRASNEHSRFTVLIYRNDDFAGSTTDFHDGPSVVPVAGTALIFSHAQLHQGASPTRGCKYVLRTDIMYRRDPAGWWDAADERQRTDGSPSMDS